MEAPGRPAYNTAIMATAAARTVFPHITTDPEVCHGRPCISGTRVRVMDVVAAHEQGVFPDELQDHFATRRLTLAEIYAALAYYNDHRDEVEADFAEAERVAAEGAASEADLERRSSR
jgi:uncharacterized protein (DUF433 family)